jgi:hypothetical protein
MVGFGPHSTLRTRRMRTSGPPSDSPASPPSAPPPQDLNIVSNWQFSTTSTVPGEPPLTNRWQYQYRSIRQFSKRRSVSKMSPDSITAIDPNRRTGNEVRSPRGQLHRCSGNFLRLTPATGGRPRQNFVVQGHSTYRRRHVRFNPPRRDGIDLNVVRGELNGHGFGQLDDRAFGRAVGGNRSQQNTA